MTRPSARAALIAIFLTAPSSVAAQVATPPRSGASSDAPAVATDTSREQAREHFQRGVQLIQDARWLDAIAELEAARDLRVTAPVLYNLGLAQRAVGRNREAVHSFRAFLELAGASRNPDLARQAETYVRELSAALGRLELRIVPPEAAIEVDGRPAERAGAHLEVDPGRRVIVARAEGFATETRAVDVVRGGTTVVVVHMVPTAIAARLHVAANLAGALIRIDGHDVGFGNADENLRPGHHLIEVRAPRHTTFQREYDAFEGTDTTIRAVLQDQRTVFERPWFWVGAAVVVGAAAAITGVALSGVDDPYRGS
ncbi:MAG: PEGA domain-containing protein [Deltaproteobacteria bacterium]